MKIPFAFLFAGFAVRMKPTGLKTPPVLSNC